ncbi:MAG TPA: hypothetical protein VGM93_11900 [Acidimicrobiales bacterium]
METPDLYALGQRRAAAKAELDRATAEAKAAALAMAAQGVSEVELSRRLKVDRMTIRDWLGKKKTKR